MTWIIGHPRTVGVGIVVGATAVGAFAGGTVVWCLVWLAEHNDRMIVGV